MATTSRLVGYIRQWRNSPPLEEQTKILEEFGCHTDNVWDKLGHALMDARRGDTFVVVRLQCLDITTLELADFLQSLEERGVDFCAINDGVDTRAPHGALILPSLLQALDLRRRLRSEATRAGLDEARAQGRVGGRRTVMSSEKMVIASELIASGQHTMAQIAKVLGVSRSSLYNSGLVVRSSKASGEKTRAAH